MTSTRLIKEKFERNAKVVELRPARGRSTSAAKIRLRDGLTCDIEEGRWKLVADLGGDSGGEDQGPAPGVYARAALGSCLAITIAQWGATLGVTIDDLEVEVASDVDAAGAYGVAEIPPGYSQVRCTVTIKSPAPEKEIRRMVDVATDRCLVWDVFARAVDVKQDLRIVAAQE
ncbi:MAG: OsmC family protein [Acidobacteriota bacterium]|nr:OsmC family protein [Acidobacteriota bacterium]